MVKPGQDWATHSPNRVSSLLREQLLTHTCLSNVYRSWWGDNKGLKTHTPTHTHILQPWWKGDTRRESYLVLLSVGIVFPNPGGSCCPLSKENPIMMPSKPCRRPPEHHAWPFTLCDPAGYPFHINLPVIFSYSRFRSFLGSLLYLSRARRAKKDGKFTIQNRDDPAFQAVYIFPNPQTVAPALLKMYVGLRGFTRQTFIWNSMRYTDGSKK